MNDLLRSKEHLSLMKSSEEDPMIHGVGFMTLKQAAKYLQLHECTLRIYCKKGKIPVAQVGRSWRIPVDILERMMNRKFSSLPQGAVGER